jgi:hypothetical protein
MKRFLIVCLFIVPGVVWAVFPLALLPGVALVFESGAMAAGYAAAIALVGGVLAWIYVSTDDGASASVPTVRPKLEVRLKDSEIANASASAISGVQYVDIGGGEGIYYPPNVVNLSSFSGNGFSYDNLNSSTNLGGVQVCEVGSGCFAYTQSYNSLQQVVGEADSRSNRYLIITSGNSNYKYDPHNVASKDGVSVPNWGRVCPSGYEYQGSGQCRFIGDNGRMYLPSDGVCPMVINSSGNFVYDPSVIDGNYGHNMDPDCYGQPNNVSSVNIATSNTKNVELQKLDTNHFKIIETDTSNANQPVVSEYVATKTPSGVQLTGGSLNSSVPGGGGDPDGGNNNGGGGGGSAVCGGPGLPACDVKVDDSGFSSTPGFVDSTAASIDASAASHVEAISNSELPKVSWNWLPSLLPGQAVACRSMPITFHYNSGFLPSVLTGSGDIDLCDKLQVVRDILGWFFGVFAVIYCWRCFINSNGGAK